MEPAPGRGGISVIVPALDEAGCLAACLDSISGGLARDDEIIVVDGGSRDGTPEMAAGYPGVRLVRTGPGRGRQMNEGARAARGAILFSLHADCRLPGGGLEMIRRAMADPGAAAGSFCLRFDALHPLLAFLALWSRVNHILFTYGDQGPFVRAGVFRRVGGFWVEPLMEDMEIQERLRRAGRFVKLARPVVTSARRYLAGGVLRRQAVNAGLVGLYRLGASPRFLARIYG